MASARPVELFTAADLLTFETMRTKVIHDAKSGLVIAIKAILHGLTLLFVLGIEYIAFREIYVYLKAPLPGEALNLSPSILALTGVVMVAAIHLRASMKPDSLPIRVLERAVDILLPLYMIGAGLMFAGILFFDGADGLFSSATQDFSIIGTPTETSTPLLTRILSQTAAPLIAVAFSLGAGAVVVVSLFVGHRSLSLLNQYVADLEGRVRKAKMATEAYRDLLAAQEAYRRINGELSALEATASRDIDREIAADIAGIISDELHAYRTHINDRHINPEPNPFELRRELDLHELESRVRDIENITPQEILQAMRGELEGRETVQEK